MKHKIKQFNQTNTQIATKSRLPRLLGTVTGLLVVAVGCIIWQQLRISNFNQQMVRLKNNQIPVRRFAGYNDCTNNGGKFLYTINGQFDACLGGPLKDAPDNYQAFLQYSAQNLPRITEEGRTTVANRVDGASHGSTDLIEFLKYDDTGCGNGQGYYRILKEIPNRFALLNYGCTTDKSARAGDYSIIALKLSDGWRLLSPTNNFDGTTPSCLLVDMFKISKSLTPKCFENTGFNNGSLKTVSYE